MHMRRFPHHDGGMASAGWQEPLEPPSVRPADPVHVRSSIGSGPELRPEFPDRDTPAAPMPD